MLRLKISPSHLTLAPRTGKCVWRPLVLFLYLPVTHTAAAQAEPARHAVWLWRAAFNTLNVRGFTQTHRTCREKHFFFLICADEWIHTSAHRRPSVQLTGTHTNLTMNVERTLKQNQNKQQLYSHTSLQKDVLSKTNMMVNLWSVHLFTLVAQQNHIARTSPLLLQDKLTKTKQKTHNTKCIDFHKMVYLLPHTDSICIPYQMTNVTSKRCCLLILGIWFFNSLIYYK